MVTIQIKNPFQHTHYSIDNWTYTQLNKIKQLISKKDRDYVIIVDGEEGCFFKGQMLQTTDGKKKIETFIKSGNYVVTMTGLNLQTGKEEEVKGKIIPSGVKEIYEIDTPRGKVKATAEHTFFIERDNKIAEVKLKDLKKGDKLICKKK